MDTMLKVENCYHAVDEGDTFHSFMDVFKRRPDHYIFIPAGLIDEYPEMKEFIGKAIEFFKLNSDFITRKVSSSKYENATETRVILYSTLSLLNITLSSSNSMHFGIDKNNFDKLLECGEASISLAFSGGCPFAVEVYKPLFDDFSPVKRKLTDNASFYIIEDDGFGGMCLDKVKVKVEDSNIPIEKMYNDDFIKVHENILKGVTQRETGLILLHGGYGTGKTSYIRRLIKTISDSESEKKVIYMPPNMAGTLSTPSFLKFLLEHKDSIIVIEDAENVLKTREAGENSAVANILNSTDGLMGDALKLTFICTFNADRESIDPALFRKGRLLQEYEFSDLDVGKARELWNHIGNPINDFPHKSMPISDIFNYGQQIECEEEENTFGFIPKK